MLRMRQSFGKRMIRISSVFALSLLFSFAMRRWCQVSTPEVWTHLSFTRHMNVNNPGPGWAYKAKLAASLVEIPKLDGEFLANLLASQQTMPRRLSSTRMIGANSWKSLRR